MMKNHFDEIAEKGEKAAKGMNEIRELVIEKREGKKLDEIKVKVERDRRE